MITKCLKSLCCLLITTGLYAQNIDSKKLDAYFKALEENNKFMGSVAVVKDGNMIYTKAVGFSNVENKTKADKNSKYRIGSISKTFTSVLVLKAAEERKINLDQTIDQYFPTLPNAQKITIRQLLNHRSGIHNFTNNEDYLTWNTSPKTEKEMLDIIAKGNSDFVPDSKSAYSNSNYVLLTYILEKAYGKSYKDLVLEKIVKPLKLQNTYLGGTINPTNNESKSYRLVNTWQPETETAISIPLGAGGIVSTPTDIALFSNALFNGKLLKSESLLLMQQMKDNFGMGLFKIPFYDKTGYGHTGGIDAFSSVFSHFEDGNISFALTSNGSNYNNNDIAIAVLSAIYDKPYTIPEFSNYNATTEELDQHVGVYSSKQIPIKITITKEGNTLLAQATGQSSFPLEGTAKNTFKFDQAGIVLLFNPSEKSMILQQGGGEFTFIKE